MNTYIRISDEKDARWQAIRHRINMDRLRESADRLHETKDRETLARQRARPDYCPHCGHAFDAQPPKP